ncbi:hypothetical protein SAMN02745163_03003 [Clostridium cavendishii DSM 21758]|uniref:Uncharacterized protein n=1 Tax=Clostridium cavendishii DSM 21758 TaxID=1121302 RepID=A0A1M6NSQ3_9CLOT|nr:hypothetical protein [Clostridium cavendishii]SHJ98729.1 hypothetical protein SAMN02745163_03003 [Clostridium cavendishii DSM 21758]
MGTIEFKDETYIKDFWVEYEMEYLREGVAILGENPLEFVPRKYIFKNEVV